MDIVDGILKKDKRSIAKAITLIESEPEKAFDILKEIYRFTGKALVLGVTGPPGAGKSTLICQLAKRLREKNKTVGILAVDPTSPFTGGAILGDRIRMQELTKDEGVYIRSMGTRGRLGGLAHACFDAVKILDAAGMDYIIVETVGVGQSEVDIISLADIVVLVLVPGMGDEVQVIKAGIMEIGDIFVVNKADLDGADRLVSQIKMNLELSYAKNSFVPPILKTIAHTAFGIEELELAINQVYNILMGTNMLYGRRKDHLKQELQELVYEIYIDKIKNRFSAELEVFTEKILNRETDPYSAAHIILSRMEGEYSNDRKN
ncbi:methylmalonyl Co-A mutase-associated GTPase MeaB [Tepidanaerobacter sp. EBM-49]|uniref:methylmalonyl Co-A mutase-associated GTPase MeaB n=1 Tax=Tepidanaerobacter sp. EBM-49 TaxID=1918504 RepID=UPI000AB3B94E|nr:methylmalonyl Co-A mutase-associated GTPase MeaB [Tepidanaerobacter sp. EBM-49]